MQRGRINSGFSRRFTAGLAAFGLSLLGVSAPIVAGPVDGIVFSQPPAQISAFGSDTEFINAQGQPAWQLEADNILFTEPVTLRHLRWWGIYGGSGTPVTPPPETELMRVRFYGARPGDGLPDDTNIISEQTFLNPFRIATGEIVNVGGLPPEFEFETVLTTPVDLEADTLYWLEIAQIGDIDSFFRWESGFGLVGGKAFINQIVFDWQFVSGSHAFELSTIPEPATASLVLWGAMLVARRPARRRRPE